MQARHVKIQDDPSRGSMKHDVWVYRTELHNDGDVPIRVVCFESYGLHHDSWCGGNIRNRVLLADDFAQWYTEGDSLDDGWLLPGKTAACDPNWHGYHEGHFDRIKWTFVAVDDKGNSYFAEAEVEQDAATHYRHPEDKES